MSPGYTLPMLRKPEVKGSSPFAGSIDSTIYDDQVVAVSFDVRIHVRIQISNGLMKELHIQTPLLFLHLI